MRQVKQQNGYLSTLLKLIPSEIIAAYVFIMGLVPVDSRKYGLAVVAGILLALTPVFLVRVHKVKSVSQVVISTLSFLVWTYAVGTPFAEWGLHVPWIASAVLFTWTTLIPKLFKFTPVGDNTEYSHLVGRR